MVYITICYIYNKFPAGAQEFVQEYLVLYQLLWNYEMFWHIHKNTNKRSGYGKGISLGKIEQTTAVQ